MMNKRREQMLDDLEAGVTKVAATFKPQIQRLKDREDQVGLPEAPFFQELSSIHGLFGTRIEKPGNLCFLSTREC